jgi:hypothetical protein
VGAARVGPGAGRLAFARATAGCASATCSRRIERRGSLSGLNASQITAAFGSSVGHVPNTLRPERLSIRTIRIPCGARNGTTGMSLNASLANCLKIGAASVPPCA